MKRTILLLYALAIIDYSMNEQICYVMTTKMIACYMETSHKDYDRGHARCMKMQQDNKLSGRGKFDLLLMIIGLSCDEFKKRIGK